MHARVKVTMGPGPAAAKRFAALNPYEGAWAATHILELLDACPPDAGHTVTGPDGEALRTLPLTVDVDAESTGVYGIHGPTGGFHIAPLQNRRAHVAVHGAPDDQPRQRVGLDRRGPTLVDDAVEAEDSNLGKGKRKKVGV